MLIEGAKGLESVNFARQINFMFNRYWRSYPWFFQLVQFIILILVLASFFVFAITPVVLNAMHVTMNDIAAMTEASSRNLINAALIVQFLTSAGIFLLPVLLFAYFTHPRPASYLGLRAPGKPVHWLLAPIVIIAATPLFLILAEWISHIDLGSSVKQAQEANDRMVKSMLSMHSTPQFIATIFVMAIMPGLSEELFFRGLLMRFAAKRSRTMVFPIVLSAILFALMHSNPYGMLSIFLAGALLGTIYYLTGSLWCSIIAHACYNGLQVLLTYGAGSNPTLKALDQANHVPLTWVAAGAVLFAGSFYLLWRTRTPLSPHWSQDYTAEELIEEAQ